MDGVGVEFSRWSGGAEKFGESAFDRTPRDRWRPAPKRTAIVV